MKGESMMLHEINQREKDKYEMISFISGTQRNKEREYPEANEDSP